MKYKGDDPSFPHLSASLNSTLNHGDDYKFSVKRIDGNSSGYFLWASGAKYVGDVKDGRRTGKGIQTWANESSYEGAFLNDMRHGEGKHVWNTGESYQGEFFKDHRHGTGTYRWPDGSEYNGRFYLDKKEGYGTFTFANGDVFEGLYGKDERCGPGVMTYHNSNKQDIGLWYRGKIVRLCSLAGDIFSIKDHPEYKYFPNEHLSKIPLEEENLADKEIEIRCSSSLLHTAFIPEDSFLPEGIEHYSKDFEHLPMTTKHKETLDRAFFKDSYDLVKSDQDAILIAKNNTPFLMDVQRQIYKHRHQAASFSEAVSTVDGSPRSAFSSEKGPLECLSTDLIMAATEGRRKVVYNLLKSGMVSPNVCDSMGNTALLGAAINCHSEIVDLLLDLGADVNHANDEGVTALNACHIFYYPLDHFKANIAEQLIESAPPPAEKKPKRRGSFGKPQSASRPQSPRITAIVKQAVEKQNRPTSSATSRNSSPSYISGVMEKHDAVECCKSDMRIKARFREISSAKSEARQRRVAAESAKSQDVAYDNESISSAWSKGSSVDTSLASKSNLIEYYVDVPEDLIERTATLLSLNKRAVSGISTRDGQAIQLGTTGALAVWKAEHNELRMMIELLLNRGASANTSAVPMPPLFFAIKAGDTDLVRLLLLKGASTEMRISSTLGGFTPLHIASAIPGKEGVLSVKYLLHAGANPNAMAEDDEIAHDKQTISDSNLSSEFSVAKKQPTSGQWVSEGLKVVDEGGRTPLHIACDRSDDYKNACDVVHELLDNGANADVIWSGHSPLSLAISSGNDLAIEELLTYGADPSIPLRRGVGNALCVASNTEFENRRSADDRIKLIDRLVEAGASLLAPVVFGSKQLVTGTAVDYAYWLFNKDTRIAHTPYHALSYQERDTYNARKRLLSHLGSLLRDAAVKMERDKLRRESRFGVRSRSPSRNERFLYTGAGAAKSTVAPASSLPPSHTTLVSASHVSFPAPTSEDMDTSVVVPSITVTKDSDVGKGKSKKHIKGRSGTGPIRKPLFRYCYECGRSVGVRLTTCSRCREVYYCSRSCKLKAWEERHKSECLRMKADQERVSPSRSEVASYFTPHTMNETLSPDAAVDSIKISPRSIVRNTEFLPVTKAEKLLSTRSKQLKTKAKHSKKKFSQTDSRTASHKSLTRSTRKAHVSKSLQEKVGKEVVFGTTGMTLAELGITENYSFE